jgi:hypothetical protein
VRVLITGNRDWTDDFPIDAIIGGLLAMVGPGELIVMHGKARGADSIADEWKWSGVEVEPYPADWDLHGRSAGPIRNRQMLDRRPDLVVAFHDDLDASKGTRDCVEEAGRRGIPVWHLRHVVRR